MDIVTKIQILFFNQLYLNKDKYERFCDGNEFFWNVSTLSSRSINHICNHGNSLSLVLQCNKEKVRKNVSHEFNVIKSRIQFA